VSAYAELLRRRLNLNMRLKPVARNLVRGVVGAASAGNSHPLPTTDGVKARGLTERLWNTGEEADREVVEPRNNS